MVASPAPKLVVSGSALNGCEGVLDTFGDPALRAREISADRRAEITAALEREARILGRRFRLIQFKFQAVSLLLKVRFAALKARANFQRFLGKLVMSSAHDFPVVLGPKGSAA